MPLIVYLREREKFRLQFMLLGGLLGLDHASGALLRQFSFLLLPHEKPLHRICSYFCGSGSSCCC